MAKLFEWGLYSAVVAAVLAFGGTDPLYFSFVQLLLLALGIAFLVAYGKNWPGRVRLPWAILLSLAALVLFQLLPLPSFLRPVLLPAAGSSSELSLNTVSIAPYETVSHWLLLLTYLTAFCLTVAVCQNHAARRRFFYLLLAVGVFEAFYGLFQYLGGVQRIFAYAKIFNVDVATGTYINRNHYAGLLEMVLPLALGLAYGEFLHLTRRRSKGSANALFSSSSAQKILFWILVAVLLFVALVYSGSRMGLLAALASVAAIGVVASTARRSARQALALVLVFLVAVGAMVVWLGLDPVIARFETLQHELGGPEPTRLDLWKGTLELIRSQGWLGSGLGTFPVAYLSVQSSFLTRFVNHAHNDYLEILSDLGPLGALLIFGSMLLLIIRQVRHFQRPNDPRSQGMMLACIGAVVAILCHSLTDFNLYVPANALVLACVLGLGYSLLQERDSTAGKVLL